MKNYIIGNAIKHQPLRGKRRHAIMIDDYMEPRKIAYTKTDIVEFGYSSVADLRSKKQLAGLTVRP